MIRLIHQLLARSPVYRFGMRMLGGEGVRKKYVQQYVRPQAGLRILDLGCGPASIRELLGDVEYIGVDMEADYIRSARERYGERGTFVHQDVTTIEPQQFGKFDIVLATALLHHLDDSQADGVLATARKMLKADGRLVTFDGCFLPEGQHPIDTWMLRNDRGKFVRTKEGYLKLIRKHFMNVKATIRQDLLTVPYTLIITESAISAPITAGNTKEGLALAGKR